VWPAYRAAGARRLVLSGGVGDPGTARAYAEAIPGCELTLVRLHAGPAQLRERILLRGEGGGPAVPGDELKGLPAEDLLRVADEAAREAEALERAGIGAIRVATDGRPVEEIARDVEVSAAAAGTAGPGAGE
jgi:hypothetical protein